MSPKEEMEPAMQRSSSAASSADRFGERLSRVYPPLRQIVKSVDIILAGSTLEICQVLNFECACSVGHFLEPRHKQAAVLLLRTGGCLAS